MTPASTSCITAKAVNPLLPEAIANRVEAVLGIWWARWAKPAQCWKMGTSPTSTLTTPEKDAAEAASAIASVLISIAPGPP